MQFARHAAAWLVCVSLAAAALAQSPRANQSVPTSALPAPTHPVILTITGAITRRNTGDAASFDAAMIDDLPAHEFRTWTPWFKEPVTFRGPRLQSVLQAVGAKGQTLHIIALNDYAVDVPVSDASQFDPILARRIDGKVLGVRDKGPLFLIYPFDSKPETRTDLFYGRSIWQVTRITVQ
ncbi:MAG: hypothetical protein ABJA49_09735 [Betaproteobacteria bacterium]